MALMRKQIEDLQSALASEQNSCQAVTARLKEMTGRTSTAEKSYQQVSSQLSELNVCTIYSCSKPCTPPFALITGLSRLFY